MSNDNKTPKQAKPTTAPSTTAANAEPHEVAPFGWRCSNGHKNVRHFEEKFLAQRAAKNHKDRTRGGRLCRDAKVTIHGTPAPKKEA